MSKEARLLFVVTYLLVGLGVVMIYSASAIYAEHVYGNPQHFLIRQLIYVAVGTVALLFTASTPLAFWKKNARGLILLSIFLLLLVFLPNIGRTAGGASRWIRLGPINFQPIEFAKVAICLYLCDYLTRKMKWIKKGSFKIYLPPLFLIGTVCLLSLLQPDLGSCAFILLVVAVLLFWSGIRLRYVFLALSAFLPVFYLLIMRVPYRLSRVTSYLNPWEDPQGSGFQIIQSFLAFGIGGIHGVGLGQSTQKLFYLPSSYNDFIFSIIGEELGLLGALFVVILYGVILAIGVQMIRRSRNDYEKLLIFSLTLLIVLQALIHMMVATGIVPTKGLPMPLVSFGGTSMVFSLMAVGLLLCIDRHRKVRR